VRLARLVDFALRRADRPLYAASGRAGRALALTYDDGPSPEVTPSLLSCLDEHGARATFFVLGREAERHPELVARIAAEGHELGNHAYSHTRGEKLGDDDVLAEIRRTGELVEAAAGSTPVLFRPPFGVDRLRATRLARRLGLRTVLWSVDSGDWRGLSAAEVADRVIARVRPGAVVLLHDGGRSAPVSLEATRVFLPELRARGFELATASELLRAPERPMRQVAAR
jgi:peptidoglycan/xylan/chitin deacetylase (PgdA/CDA1 family)